MPQGDALFSAHHLWALSASSRSARTVVWVRGPCNPRSVNAVGLSPTVFQQASRPRGVCIASCHVAQIPSLVSERALGPIAHSPFVGFVLQVPRAPSQEFLLSFVYSARGPKCRPCCTKPRHKCMGYARVYPENVSWWPQIWVCLTTRKANYPTPIVTHLRSRGALSDEPKRRDVQDT